MDHDETEAAGNEAAEQTEVERPAELEDEAGTQGDEQEEGAAEEAENDDEAAAQNPDEVRKDEIKGLSPEAQAKVNRRIGKVVAREKAALSRAETAEQELTEARSKLEGGLPELVKRLGLHGELVDKDEAKLVDRYTQLKAWKAFCRRYERDGYEGKGGEDQSMSPEEIREKLSTVEDELEEIGSRARDVQARVDKQAREIFARGLAAMKADKGKGKEKSAEKPKRPAKPPKLPTGSATPKPAANGKKVQSKFDMEEFKKQGASKDALEKQFEKYYGG